MWCLTGGCRSLGHWELSLPSRCAMGAPQPRLGHCMDLCEPCHWGNSSPFWSQACLGGTLQLPKHPQLPPSLLVQSTGVFSCWLDLGLPGAEPGTQRGGSCLGWRGGHPAPGGAPSSRGAPSSGGCLQLGRLGASPPVTLAACFCSGLPVNIPDFFEFAQNSSRGSIYGNGVGDAVTVGSVRLLLNFTAADYLFLFDLLSPLCSRSCKQGGCCLIRCKLLFSPR